VNDGLQTDRGDNSERALGGTARSLSYPIHRSVGSIVDHFGFYQGSRQRYVAFFVRPRLIPAGEITRFGSRVAGAPKLGADDACPVIRLFREFTA
jgi:hypothetical protein